MKRTLPFPIYDITGYANPDGTGRHNWSQAHPSEEVVGRIRKDGGIDRRYRMAVRKAYVWPEPRPVTRWEQVREVVAILLSMAVLATWGVALFWGLPIIFAALTNV